MRQVITKYQPYRILEFVKSTIPCKFKWPFMITLGMMNAKSYISITTTQSRGSYDISMHNQSFSSKIWILTLHLQSFQYWRHWIPSWITAETHPENANSAPLQNSIAQLDMQIAMLLLSRCGFILYYCYRIKAPQVLQECIRVPISQIHERYAWYEQGSGGVFPSLLGCTRWHKVLKSRRVFLWCRFAGIDYDFHQRQVCRATTPSASKNDMKAVWTKWNSDHWFFRT